MRGVGSENGGTDVAGETQKTGKRYTKISNRV